MKKLNKYLLILATAVFAFTACEEEILRDPSPAFEGNASVTFPKSSVSCEIDPKDAHEYEVLINRIEKDTAYAALDVALNVVENTSNVFEVPEKVSFAAGAKSTSFLVKFPSAQIDSIYNLVIQLDNGVSDPYKDEKATFSLTVNVAKWDDVTDKKAIVFDGIINVFYGTGKPGWYVPYQRKANSDGSFDIRLLNPYTILPEYKEGDDGKPNYDAPISDKFGLYKGFPYNYPGDVDSKGTYNMTIHVAKDGTATFKKFQLGMIWTYGAFYGAHSSDKGLGRYDDGAKSITFPAGSVYCAMADYKDGAFYPGDNDMVIFLDSAQWQDEHSAITVSSFENAFNDAAIEWKQVAGNLHSYISSIDSDLKDLKLLNAVDPNVKEKQGPGSDFYNLYYLADVYAKGYGLAFYWDSVKGKISLPVDPQPMGKKFASKKIYLAPSAEHESSVEEIELKGDKVKVFHFFLQVMTKDGGNLGVYEETFYLGPNEIVWEKDDYIGNFLLTGKSLLGGADANMNVEIVEDKGGDLYLLGVKYADSIAIDFDATSGSISIVPQELPNLIIEEDTLDITFLTFDGDDASETAPIELAFDLTGSINITKESPAFGYLLYSDAAGGFVAGYYNLQFSPSKKSAAVPYEAPRISAKSKASIIKPSTKKKAGFRLQGQLPRHQLRKY